MRGDTWGAGLTWSLPRGTHASARVGGAATPVLLWRALSWVLAALSLAPAIRTRLLVAVRSVCRRRSKGLVGPYPPGLTRRRTHDGAQYVFSTQLNGPSLAAREFNRPSCYRAHHLGFTLKLSLHKYWRSSPQKKKNWRSSSKK